MTEGRRTGARRPGAGDGQSARRPGAGDGQSARRPGAGDGQSAGGAAERIQTATYRGIRWRRDPDGTIGWFNEGRGGWVRWRPGGDAPPVPPRWEADVATIPLPPRVKRASWRSPYRLVPIVLVAAAVVYGVVQATHTGDDAAVTANREARALAGRCLAVKSHKAGAVSYSTSPVACTSPVAAVKVVAVHDAAAGDAACPSGAGVLQLSYVGVRTPDIECVTTVHHG